MTSSTFLAVLVASCMVTQGCSARENSVRTRAIPLARDYRALTRLNTADFDVDRNGTVHLVTYMNYGRPGAPEGCRLYYQASMRGSQAAWTKPTLLLDEVGQDAQIIVAGSALHVLAGASLAHFYSNDGGRSWEHGSNLAKSVQAWHATSVGDTLFVAYLVNVVPASRDSFPVASELHVLRIHAASGGNDRALVRFPVRAAFPSLHPRIRAAQGGQLDLVCCMAAPAESWASGAQVPLRESGLVGQVLCWRSEDVGQTWSRPSAVPLANSESVGAWGRVGALGFNVPAIDLVRSGKRLVVAVAMGALVCFTTNGDDTWAGPDTLESGGVAEGPGTIQLTDSEPPLVAWITEAFQAPPPRFLGEAISRRGRDAVVSRLLRPAFPLRLTPPKTIAECLRCRSVGDAVLCTWIGLPQDATRDRYNPDNSLFLSRFTHLAIERNQH